MIYRTGRNEYSHDYVKKIAKTRDTTNGLAIVKELYAIRYLTKEQYQEALLDLLRDTGYELDSYRI